MVQWNNNILDVIVDDVATWNDALSANEVTALYNSGIPLTVTSNSGNYTSSANLKAYWRHNENTGSVTYDLSGNGNHGTINGATSSTPGASNVPVLSNDIIFNIMQLTRLEMSYQLT